MKILVTGATGFIGSRLFRESSEIVRSNIENPISLKEEFKTKAAGEPYTVIHCAGISDVDKCEEDKKRAWEVNVLGTKNVAEAIDPKLGRMIFLSSCQVFNGNYYFPYSEKHAPDPINWYGSTKFGAEATLSTFPMESLVVRIGRAYHNELIDSVLEERGPIPSFQTRNFIRVEDLVYVLTKLADLKNFSSIPKFKNMYRVLHVGNPNQNFKYSHFYNLIRQWNNRPPLPVRDYELTMLTPRPKRCALDLSLMGKVLPKIAFRSL